MRHQKTDCPPNKAKQKKIPRSLNQRVTRGIQVNTRIKDHPTSQDLIQTRHMKEEIDAPGLEILNMLKVLNVLQESFNARPAINMGTLSACATGRRYLSSQEIPRHISCKWDWYMYKKKIQYVASQVIWPPVMNHSGYKQRYSTNKLNPSFPHLIISLLILPIDWSHTTREISNWKPDWIHVLM